MNIKLSDIKKALENDKQEKLLNNMVSRAVQGDKQAKEALSILEAVTKAIGEEVTK